MAATVAAWPKTMMTTLHIADKQTPDMLSPFIPAGELLGADCQIRSEVQSIRWEAKDEKAVEWKFSKE